MYLFEDIAIHFAFSLLAYFIYHDYLAFLQDWQFNSGIQDMKSLNSKTDKRQFQSF